MAGGPPLSHSVWIKSCNAVWQKILHLGRKQQYGKNELIGGNGEYVKCLRYLHKGRLKLTRFNAEGNEKIFFYIEQRNLFGEVPFWSGKPMDSAFIAVEPCEVYEFSQQCIKDDVMRNHPELMSSSRKKRISAGSGITLHEINIFIKQFEQMRTMMKGMSGLKDKMKGGKGMPNMAQAMNMMRKFILNALLSCRMQTKECMKLKRENDSI